MAVADVYLVSRVNIQIIIFLIKMEIVTLFETSISPAFFQTVRFYLGQLFSWYYRGNKEYACRD